MDGLLEGLVHRHDVRATADFVRVACAGHVAGLKTVVIVAVDRAAPALFHSIKGGVRQQAERGDGNMVKMACIDGVQGFTKRGEFGELGSGTCVRTRLTTIGAGAP